MADLFQGSQESAIPSAPPKLWSGAGAYSNEPPRYQSLAVEDSITYGRARTQQQYPTSPRTRRHTLNRSIAFAGASIGHFFGVHDDPTNRGWRRTGTYNDVNYHQIPNTEDRTQDQSQSETPSAPQRQRSRLTTTLNRAATLFKRKKPNRDEVMKSLPKFWPIMTVLIALIEIGLMVAMCVTFGLAPIAFLPTEDSANVMGFDNQTEYQTREIVPNFFIGPSSSSLVHAGAMYTPCIRDNRDFQLLAARTNFEESKLRCCKSASMEQCGMLQQETCIGDRYRGSVLGGASRCRAELNTTSDCNGGVVLHPCCVGILGGCSITTEANCTFQKGYWHPDKLLCSEVDCFADICRFNWINRTLNEIPDQGLRFISAIFLYHGIVTLVIVGLIKLYNSWMIERRIGFLRFTCIYLVSGVGGFLLSGIFDPTSVSVGGSGPLFGLIGVLLVELAQGWKWVNKPCLELFKLLVLIILLLAIGTLPYVDNFSQIGGFVFGILASFIFVPYITLGNWDRAIKLCLILTAIPIILTLFLFGFVIFYFNTEINFCPVCNYINCIPYTPTFCTEFISNLLSILPVTQ